MFKFDSLRRHNKRVLNSTHDSQVMLFINLTTAKVPEKEYKIVPPDIPNTSVTMIFLKPTKHGTIHATILSSKPQNNQAVLVFEKRLINFMGKGDYRTMKRTLSPENCNIKIFFSIIISNQCTITAS